MVLALRRMALSVLKGGSPRLKGDAVPWYVALARTQAQFKGARAIWIQGLQNTSQQVGDVGTISPEHFYAAPS